MPCPLDAVIDETNHNKWADSQKRKRQHTFGDAQPIVRSKSPMKNTIRMVFTIPKNIQNPTKNDDRYEWQAPIQNIHEDNLTDSSKNSKRYLDYLLTLVIQKVESILF